MRFNDLQTYRQLQRNWKISDFQIISQLGRGKFGQVYAARQKKSDYIVALKIMKKNEINQYNYIQQVKRQIIIQSNLNHRNLLRLFGWFYNSQNFYLILQLAPLGDLYSYIKRAKNIQQKQIVGIIYQLVDALIYLHQKNIIHRDIKPQNILITNKNIKLADFGWAIKSNVRRQTFCGTIDYLSPQMLRGQLHDNKVDVWAVGILAYQLFAGYPPFEVINIQETLHRIMKVQPTYPSNMSKQLKQFISACLQKKPEHRMSAEELLNLNLFRLYPQNNLEFSQ